MIRTEQITALIIFELTLSTVGVILGFEYMELHARHLVFGKYNGTFFSIFDCGGPSYVGLSSCPIRHPSSSFVQREAVGNPLPTTKYQARHLYK